MDFLTDPRLVFYLNPTKHDGTVFMSDDAYGHKCTKTGVPWEFIGMPFAGVSDVVTLPSNIANHSFASDVPGSVGVWSKFALADAAGGLLTKGAANKYEWFFAQDTVGTGEVQFRCFSSTAGSRIGRRFQNIGASYNGLWVFWFATYSGSKTSAGIKIFNSANGVMERVDNADDEDLVPAYTGMTDNGEPVTIGSVWGTGGFFDGSIGEVWIYNDALLEPEIQDIYLETRDEYA